MSAVYKSKRQWLPPHGTLKEHTSIAKIDWLAVDVDFQRKGAATKLVNAAEGFARHFRLPGNRDIGMFKYLRLSVSTHQADAVQFYRKVGYKRELLSNDNLYLMKGLLLAEAKQQ